MILGLLPWVRSWWWQRPHVVVRIAAQTSQTHDPERGPISVARDTEPMGNLTQNQDTAPGWDPVEELSTPTTSTHAEVGAGAPNETSATLQFEAGGETVTCMEEQCLVDRAGCMDMDVPMHATNDLLLPPKEQIAEPTSRLSARVY